MPRKPNRNGTKRVQVRLSEQVAVYLTKLADLGIHGTTQSEVAKKLVENEVERLIREGILHLGAKQRG